MLKDVAVNVCLVALTLLTLACGVSHSVTTQVSAYYVAPNGDNTNSGTLERPWRTIRHALARLSPGDTLYLRGGTYYERHITVRLKGTASAPITVQSFPGERATLDGGIPAFRTVPNDSWELVNESIQLYRSKQIFSTRLVRAWLVADNRQLVEYDTAANLEATNYDRVNGFEPLYMGPGVQLRDDGRIYIRLQYNPSDQTDSAGNVIAAVPADTNPNNNEIAVFTSEHILLLDGAAYLNFTDLNFAYSQRIMDVRNGSHHIALGGSSLRFGSYGLVLREDIHDWTLAANDFSNGLPDYVYWTDVKNGDREVAEAYPEFQSAAMVGPMRGFTITGNTFHETFDAIGMGSGSADTRITDNVFKQIRDDAFELEGVGNIEIARNLLWRVGSGISINLSEPDVGSVYIHHNIIDNSAFQRGGRPNNYRDNTWPVWMVIDPFSSHDSSNKISWWKIYNNTIVTRRSGYQNNSAGPESIAGNPEKYVYNNIFYVIDDRVILSDDQPQNGSRYDGNLFYQRTSEGFPLFRGFGNGRDYDSLAEFRARSGTDWETHGLELDPGFDLAAIADPTFDAATIWDRYRPTDCRAYTPGAPYRGLDWPGLEGVTYRGAMPPQEAVRCRSVLFLPSIVASS